MNFYDVFAFLFISFSAFLVLLDYYLCTTIRKKLSVLAEDEGFDVFPGRICRNTLKPGLISCGIVLLIWTLGRAADVDTPSLFALVFLLCTAVQGFCVYSIHHEREVLRMLKKLDKK